PAPLPSAAVPASPAAAVPAAVPAAKPAEPKEMPKVDDIDFVATEGAACRIDDPDCEACQ
ncbi:hypothetical protein, partial [Amycolatopsis sp. NPDC050768]|uniref:hypothetical protein n=1 Tax=Amycolatopsis sp. NPDC050768 TaxID=3154839 RepID=UPI003400CAB9